jgi:hypothetical protein
MCETEDPLTHTRDGNTLLRVSVVDGLDVTRVLLDALVQPVWPVTELRTNVHGITASMLSQAPPFTLRHAQAAVLNLCTSATILVGQSLCNDLSALKLSHR